MELPFVIGIMADLTGTSCEELGQADELKFLDIDADRHDGCMKVLKPRLAIAVANTLTGAGHLAVDIKFERMNDFSPTSVARGIPPLEKRLRARTQLDRLKQLISRKPNCERLLVQLLRDSTLLHAIGESEHVESIKSIANPNDYGVEEADFEDAFVAPLRALASVVQKYEELVRDEPSRAIDAAVGRLDGELSQQLNEVMHNSQFQRLEGTWRGLDRLLRAVDRGATIKVKVMDISKEELHRALLESARLQDNPLYKQIVNAGFEPGGDPFGLIIGDYYFDHGPSDIHLLEDLAHIAAAAHSPFVAGASPALFRLNAWRDLHSYAGPERSGIHKSPHFVAWDSLRASEDTKFVALTMPRYLARLPYGAETHPAMEFDFTEDWDGRDHANLVWTNSAFAMGQNIARAFGRYGWCARICGHESGIVADLPCLIFSSNEGYQEMVCPTEVSIPNRLELELSDFGLAPLCHMSHEHLAVFFSAQSLYRPRSRDVNEKMCAKLPILLCLCRFVHYVRSILVSRTGAFTSARELEQHLRRWIVEYVTLNPNDQSGELAARFPLSGAEIGVEELPHSPGSYIARCSLQPHYQLAADLGLTACLEIPPATA